MNQETAPADPSAEEGGRKPFTGGRTRLAAWSVLLAAAIFVVDLFLPIGFAGGAPYLVPVLLGWQLQDLRYVVGFGVAATLFIVAGYLLAPPGGVAWMDLSDRGVAIFTIWITVVIFFRAKRAASATRPSNDVLAHRLEARTAELRETRAALGRAERLAAMGQLTGTVAHELRNPLGVISTSIAAIEIRSREAGLDLAGALNRAERAIKRCATIITEHLDFTRAKGHQPVSLILDYWLSGVLDEMTVTGDILLDRDLRTGGAVVRFDPETLRRAIINLVDNACQAIMDEPRETAVGRLSVASRMDGDGAEITVADNGPGMPPDVLARITEPLFSTRTFGTGLGLPTVQHIMAEHGGSLRIESEPGLGTRVSLRLPNDG